MALKWIKLKTDIFTNDKMLLLDTYEDGIYYQMIWLKLLCLAGRKENHGVFMMRDGRGYSVPMLSHILSVDEGTLEDALLVFEELCMINTEDGIIKILGWREHQEDYFDESYEDTETSADERKRRQAKERMRRMRERKRSAFNEADSTASESENDSVTQGEMSVTDRVTGCVTSVTECVTSVTPLININNRTEKKKEEHTSLKEERENKKESTVTENDNGENLSISREERDFENSFFLNNAVCDTAVDRDDSYTVERGQCHPERRAMPEVEPIGRRRASGSIPAVLDENTSLPSPIHTKSAYGAFDNVMLTDTEYNAFVEKFPEDYADRIDELSIYLATSGKEYKNHYATLLSFAKTRFAEREASFNMGNRHNMGNGCGNYTAGYYSSTASGPPSLTREGL